MDPLTWLAPGRFRPVRVWRFWGSGVWDLVQTVQGFRGSLTFLAPERLKPVMIWGSMGLGFGSSGKAVPGSLGSGLLGSGTLDRPLGCRNVR